MKLKASDLQTIVRKVVREELEMLLPKLIKEHLAENYIRKLVKESSPQQPLKGGLNLKELATQAELEEEDPPSPKKNDDLGIYNDNPGSLRRDEGAQRFLSKNPMAFLYEDTQPVSEREIVSPYEQMTEKLTEGMDFSKFVNAMDEEHVSRKPVVQSNEAKMREIEMRRKMLDVPVGNLRK